nr:MAG TPA: hypothetical protein [Caudoviricetes sp.]
MFFQDTRNPIFKFSLTFNSIFYSINFHTYRLNPIFSILTSFSKVKNTESQAAFKSLSKPSDVLISNYFLFLYFCT